MRALESTELRHGCGLRSPHTRLRRSTTDRVVSGVAGGMAQHFGVDPVWVRLAFVLTTIWGGVGLVVYLVLAFVLPEGEQVEDVLARRLEDGEISAEEYRRILADVTGASNGSRRSTRSRGWG